MTMRVGGEHHVVNGTFALSPPTAANFIQQVAYQSSGKGIMGQPGPLSLAALGTGAFRVGARAIKTFRSSGLSVAISGNRSNSGRMGVTLTVDPPQIPIVQTMCRTPRSQPYRRRDPRTIALGAIVSKGKPMRAGKRAQQCLGGRAVRP
jgi:hypothetical protein